MSSKYRDSLTSDQIFVLLFLLYCLNSLVNRVQHSIRIQIGNPCLISHFPGTVFIIFPLLTKGWPSRYHPLPFFDERCSIFSLFLPQCALQFIRYVFCIFWNAHVISVFMSIIWWFTYDKPILGDKALLVVISNLSVKFFEKFLGFWVFFFVEECPNIHYG